MSRSMSQEKASEWKNKIQQQKVSGKNVVHWCRENNESPRVFYYWKIKLAGQETCEAFYKIKNVVFV